MELNADYFKKLHEIEKTLEAGRSMIDEQYIDNFSLQIEQVEKGWRDTVDTNRTLRIGIVGGVKAGKSSFLNALLFNGRDILPKAATPMTAALTKISYSEKPYAKIVFYAEKDWNAIIQNSQKYDEQLEKEIANEKKRREEAAERSLMAKKMQRNLEAVPGGDLDPYTMARLRAKIAEEYRACKELTDMADKRGVAFATLLGGDKEIPLSENLEADLKEYVGADGTYTPFVKYIELGMNEPMLEDLEIIDTPGLNDPIVSRSIVTKKFLQNCDVAFLMSYCGQFMSAQDVSFLLKALPQKGIGHVVLLGSKFDSVLLEKSYRELPLKRAKNQLKAELFAAAANTIKRNSTSSQAKRMEDALPPVFISSLLYAAAQKIKNHQTLAGEEKELIDHLGKAYQEFEKNDADFLMDVANIDSVYTQKLAKYKQDKDRILQERSEDYIKQNELSFLEQLNEIQKAAQKNLSDLEELDKGEIIKKQKAISRALEKARGAVELTFKEAAFDVKKQLQSIEHVIMGEQNRFRNVKIQDKSEDERYCSHTTGFLFWKKKHYSTRHIEWREASVADAAILAGDFAREAKRHLEEDLQPTIPLGEIEAKLENQIMNVFHVADVPFEPDDILGPVKLVLKDLTLPSVSVNPEVYQDKLEKAFPSNVVIDNDVEKLRLDLERILTQIEQDMENELRNLEEKTSQKLNTEAGQFVGKIQKKIQDSGDRLVKQLEEKEKNIEDCKKFIQDIKGLKLSLRTVG